MPLFFFFNDTAPTEIYTLSLHDALPISQRTFGEIGIVATVEHTGSPRPCLPAVEAEIVSIATEAMSNARQHADCRTRSEEHTSELQSRQYLVCRLLLEKKKHDYTTATPI